MFDTLGEAVEYMDKSNIMSRERFWDITSTELASHIVYLAVLLAVVFFLGALFQRPIGYRETGLALDAYGAVALANATIGDYLNRLYRDSSAPGAQRNHTDRTIRELEMTIAQVVGLGLLVLGFGLQLGSAIF